MCFSLFQCCPKFGWFDLWAQGAPPPPFESFVRTGRMAPESFVIQSPIEVHWNSRLISNWWIEPSLPIKAIQEGQIFDCNGQVWSIERRVSLTTFDYLIGYNHSSKSETLAKLLTDLPLSPLTISAAFRSAGPDKFAHWGVTGAAIYRDHVDPIGPGATYVPPFIRVLYFDDSIYGFDGQNVKIVECDTSGSVTDWGNKPNTHIGGVATEIEIDDGFVTAYRYESLFEYWLGPSQLSWPLVPAIKRNRWQSTQFKDDIVDKVIYCEWQVGSLTDNTTHTSVASVAGNVAKRFEITVPIGYEIDSEGFYTRAGWGDTYLAGEWLSFHGRGDEWVGLARLISKFTLAANTGLPNPTPPPPPNTWYLLSSGGQCKEHSTRWPFYIATSNPTIQESEIQLTNKAVCNGVIASVQTAYTTEPTSNSSGDITSPGVLEDSARPYVIIFYKDGVEIWRSLPLGGAPPTADRDNHIPPVIIGGSKRWVYVAVMNKDINTPSINVNSVDYVTGGEFTGDDLQGMRVYLIKHDGSEIVPTGKLNTDPAITTQFFGAASGSGINEGAIVQYFDEIALPDTYAEMRELS
jgi:hypothetical protein